MMKAYWVKTNLFIKKLFSGYIWDIPNAEKSIYLTFDDGPTPEITAWVLQLLKKHKATATFFCIGKNIEENVAIFQTIVTEGHSIGNHTYNHVNGWKTATASYIENFDWCDRMISNFSPHPNYVKLFRPPYGKIKRGQAKYIKAEGHKIIMWDVLSAGFDQAITKEECLKNVISNVRPGSIIVFHDSVKAFANLEYVLPKTLEFLDRNQYNYGTIQ